MVDIMEKLEPGTWFEMNAKLQQKKNAIRKVLKERGVLKREGSNTFDKYKYFTEAQYKTLFTELLSEHNLELKFNEIEYETFSGTEKQANGRMPKLVFRLTDCETGFYEESTITGEGIDKGDKAGYKAYTGALKYYLANTFLVATGDDPERESPNHTMNKKGKAPDARVHTALVGQITQLAELKHIPLIDICQQAGVKKVEEMEVPQMESCVEWLKGL